MAAVGVVAFAFTFGRGEDLERRTHRGILHPGLHAAVLLLRLPQPAPHAPGAGAVLESLPVRGHRRLGAAPVRRGHPAADAPGVRHPGPPRRRLASHPAAGPGARDGRRGGKVGPRMDRGAAYTPEVPDPFSAPGERLRPVQMASSRVPLIRESELINERPTGDAPFQQTYLNNLTDNYLISADPATATRRPGRPAHRGSPAARVGGGDHPLRRIGRPGGREGSRGCPGLPPGPVGSGRMLA